MTSTPSPPGTPAQCSTVILLWVEGSKASRSTRGTTTHYCGAQRGLAGRGCMLWPGVKLVTLLFSPLRMRVPKYPSLFRVPFCTLLVCPHSVLDTTKQMLTPESTFQQGVAIIISYPQSEYSPPLPPGAQHGLTGLCRALHLPPSQKASSISVTQSPTSPKHHSASLVCPPEGSS